jgi:hypothetical protein
MTRDEHEPQQVVAHLVIERLGELGFRTLLPRLQLVADLRVLAVEHRASS